MSWICEIPALPDSFIIEPVSLPTNCFDVVLLVRVLEQFEILHTFLTNAVFSAPILSSVDVVQHMFDSVVAKRLPRVVFEGSVLYVSRIFAHLGSLFLMLPPSPKFLADPPELELLHGNM